jgi:hypothetical protein
MHDSNQEVGPGRKAARSTPALFGDQMIVSYYGMELLDNTSKENPFKAIHLFCPLIMGGERVAPNRVLY